MAGFMQNVQIVNSAVRTLLALAAIVMVAAGSWWGYSTYHAADIKLRAQETELKNREQRILALEGDLQLAKERVAKLETAVRLLKVDHRLAQVTILAQGKDENGQDYTEVEFVEVNNENQPIDKVQHFRLTGKMLHISCRLVKFLDKYIELADPDRATTLCLFNRIYGDGQKPKDGYTIDKSGTRPGAYNRGGRMTEFESKIWDDFWNIANDDSKAQALGIRAAHEQAIIMEARVGKQYKILLRASDGLSIMPEKHAKPVKPAG